MTETQSLRGSEVTKKLNGSRGGTCPSMPLSWRRQCIHIFPVATYMLSIDELPSARFDTDTYKFVFCFQTLPIIYNTHDEC